MTVLKAKSGAKVTPGDRVVVVAKLLRSTSKSLTRRAGLKQALTGTRVSVASCIDEMEAAHGEQMTNAILKQLSKS